MSNSEAKAEKFLGKYGITGSLVDARLELTALLNSHAAEQREACADEVNFAALRIAALDVSTAYELGQVCLTATGDDDDDE